MPPTRVQVFETHTLWDGLSFPLGEHNGVISTEITERFSSAIGPAYGDIVCRVVVSQTENDPWVTGGEVTARGLDLTIDP